MLFSGKQKQLRGDDEDVSPVRKNLPPGGRLPPLNHKPYSVTRHQEEDDDDDDEDEDEMSTNERPRSAAGPRQLPPLPLGDLGSKDYQKN